MNHTNQIIEEMIDDEQVKIDVRKGNLDLVILKYMARRLHLLLKQPIHIERSTAQEPMLAIARSVRTQR